MYRGCDCRRGMDWILDLLTPLRAASTFSATANLHTLQITTAPAKPLSACCSLTSRSLTTASNGGISSASRVQVLLPQPPVQNSCQFPQLPTLNSLWIIRSADPGFSLYSLGADQTENAAFDSFSIVVDVFTDPLPINGRWLTHLFHSNGCTSFVSRSLLGNGSVHHNTMLYTVHVGGVTK
jgi:hypothetical protein